MVRVRKAVLGVVLLAGTALAMSAPAKAQGAQFEGYVGTDPYGAAPSYGAEPYYDPNYQDPAYGQGYQDPAYDPQYGQGYQDPYYGDQYSEQYPPEYYGDQYGDQYGYGDQNGYDWADPYYYTAPAYTPIYDPFYDPYCDYYTPPWGFPLDYCRYQLWRQPVYFGGLWYSGPIYYRTINTVNWFWINGSWCRDQWVGSRPSYIDWSSNRRWDGPRHNWRDEYRRGTWAGRNTWVGRNYRDNIREARANVLDRGRDREFRRDFAARNLRRTADGVGPRGRGGEFNGRRLDRGPGVVNEGRTRDFTRAQRDPRTLRDGGSTLVRPNERGPVVRGGPGAERREFANRPDRTQRFENRARPQQNFASPERAPRIENRARNFAPVDPGRRFENRAAPQRSFAAPERGPRLENRGAQRSFSAPERGPRVDNRAAQRSFAAPNRAPRMESRAPRVENRGFAGSRNSFAAPGGAPRVARPSGGQRFDAGNRGGGGGRAFSGGGGGSPRAFSGGGGGSPRASSGGGGGSPRASSGGNRGGGGNASRGGGNRASRGDRGR